MIKLILFLYVFFSLNAQSNYSKLLKEAWSFYKAKEFIKSGNTYLKAFQLNKELKTENQISARFNGACAWSLAGNNDEAFSLLNEILESGLYTNLNQLNTDSDLKIFIQIQGGTN